MVCLGVLDSTHPDQVAKAAADYPPDKSLYIVASKSGGTAEVSAAFDFFWASEPRRQLAFRGDHRRTHVPRGARTETGLSQRSFLPIRRLAAATLR